MNRACVPRKLALAAAIASVILPLTRAQNNAGALDKAIDATSQLVVMITDRLGTEPAFGAGIVFGRDKDRLYIVTANHVVRRGATEASNIRVAFKSRPDKPLAAKLAPHADHELDVAVVVLEGWAAQGVEACQLAFDNLGDPAKLQRGNTVYAVGNPNGENWRMPTPDRLYNAAPDQLAFQSAFIAVGSSGGALLNDNADIVGMVRRDEPPSGSAIPLSVVLPLVSKWGYPVQLWPGQRDGGTPLHTAAAAGDIGRIRSELALPCPDTNTGDIHGDTPLLRAVDSGQLEAVRLLIGNGANVNVKAQSSASVDVQPEPVVNTALHRAAAQHDLPIAALLLKAGADVNAKDDAGATPLLYAAPVKKDTPEVAHAKAEFARRLIQAGADVNVPGRPYRGGNGRMYGGDPLLHMALAARNREMVAALLEAHANVNLKGRSWPPLTIAIESGDMESIQQLLRAGADVNGEGNPIYAALGLENGPAVALLLRAGGRPTNPNVPVFRKAIDRDWIEVVKLLLDAGTDINKPIDSGGPLLPPLVYALKVNRLEIAKFLIANKADVNLAGKFEGNAPLHLAASNKSGAALIILLLGAGANVNAANQRQETSLHVAIRSANEEAAKALLQAGAAIDAKNSGGETPMTLAKGTPLEALLTSYAGR